MTNQEAAEMIRNDMKLHHDYLSGTYRKALNMAISALEKQIPKEPAVMIDTWICPSCNNGIEYQFLLGDNVLFHGFHDFCQSCGQAIDWTEGE